MLNLKVKSIIILALITFAAAHASSPFTTTNDFRLSLMEFLKYKQHVEQGENRETIMLLLETFDKTGMIGVQAGGDRGMVLIFDETGTHEYRAIDEELSETVVATMDLINRQIFSNKKKNCLETINGRIIFSEELIRYYNLIGKDQDGQEKEETVRDVKINPYLIIERNFSNFKYTVTISISIFRKDSPEKAVYSNELKIKTLFETEEDAIACGEKEASSLAISLLEYRAKEMGVSEQELGYKAEVIVN